MHYYNRVVKPKKQPKKRGGSGAADGPFYFVVFYEEETEKVRLAPMEAKGVLSGRREGRPRWQVALGDDDSNFITGDSQDYDVVAATMVMKTPLVASEAWDIEED